MIRKFFNNSFFLKSQPSRSVAAAAFVITLAGLASRLLGLLRDRFLASTFGAGDTLDVYYAAFRIPDLIYNLLILGALSAAFIPVFTSLVSKDEESSAWQLASEIMNLAIIFIICLSIILAFFAPYIMRVLTPGFTEDKMQSVVSFTRIMFLSPLFLGISGIFGGILTSFKRFLVYSIAPLFYNLGIIVGVLFLVKIDFIGPIGLAWGVVLGAFLHMLIQYPAARSLGFNFSLTFFRGFKNNNVKRILVLMVPRMLGIAVNQVNLLIITIFASLLASGSLAIFNFAQNLQGVPVGIFGSSFAIAVFPILSSLAAKDNRTEFVRYFSETFRQILFFAIPISVFILVLRAQIVRVVLGTGEFDWNDTILTYQCLGIFVLSLFAQSLIPLLARTFFALHNTKTPFYIALVSETINILIVLLLLERFKLLGLAIAFSFSSVVQMFLLLFFLRSKFKNLDDRGIIIFLAKIATASLISGVAIQLAKYAVAFNTPTNFLDTFVGIFTQLMVASFVGLAVFIFSCYLLKIKEFFKFKHSLSRKLFGYRKIITEDTSDVSGI